MAATRSGRKEDKDFDSCVGVQNIFYEVFYHKGYLVVQKRVGQSGKRRVAYIVATELEEE